MSIDITMPRLSDTMEQGTIIKWNVAEGDEVSAGDAIADIETDKATMEMQVYDDGKVAKILVDEGTTADVGTRIAVLAEEDEDIDDVAQGAASADGKAAEGEEKEKAKEEKSARKKDDRKGQREQEDEDGKKRKKTTEEMEPAATGATTRGAETPSVKAPSRDGARPDGDGKLKVSPVARRIADEHDIDLRSVEGSGPGGRIIKRDILKAVEAGEETAAAVPPSALTRADEEAGEEEKEARKTAAMPVVRTEGGIDLEDQVIQVSNMRQTIAKRLVESKTTVPHYQVTYTFSMDPLLEMRRELNEQLASHNVKLSVNDFLVRCCALAMYDNPFFNASWEGDKIRVHGEINIGMAISLPAERGGGLVVGVIRNADQKSLRAISAESKRLAEKARNKGLTLDEMSDSTFTLSNLGMYGVEHFTAIINPPNSAILAVGAAVKKPVVRNDEIVVGREMQATLSSDHRVIDGAMSAQYLASLKDYIENPASLLV